MAEPFPNKVEHISALISESVGLWISSSLQQKLSMQEFQAADILLQFIQKTKTIQEERSALLTGLIKKHTGKQFIFARPGKTLNRSTSPAHIHMTWSNRKCQV